MFQQKSLYIMERSSSFQAFRQPWFMLRPWQNLVMFWIIVIRLSSYYFTDQSSSKCKTYFQFLSSSLFLYQFILQMRPLRTLCCCSVDGEALRDIDLARGGGEIFTSFCGLNITAVLDRALTSGPNTLSYAYFFKILDLFPICDSVPRRQLFLQQKERFVFPPYFCFSSWFLSLR